MIKYYPIKTNGEIKKTPIIADNLLDLHKKICNYYDTSSLKYIESSNDLDNSYALIDKEKVLWKDLLSRIKEKVDEHNLNRQNSINKLHQERKLVLDKEVNEKLSNEEKMLFWLLYDNLEIKVYENEYANNKLPISLTFKGINLFRVKILKNEVPAEIIW